MWQRKMPSRPQDNNGSIPGLYLVICRGEMFLCLLYLELGKSDFCAQSICFWSFFMFEEDCNVTVLVIVLLISLFFPWHQSITCRRWLLRRTARSYFKSGRDTSVWNSQGDSQQLQTRFLFWSAQLQHKIVVIILVFSFTYCHWSYRLANETWNLKWVTPFPIFGAKRKWNPSSKTSRLLIR